MSSIILNPFQLLELNVISAQDLAPVSRKMKTYAVAWVNPDRKLSTRVDINGHNNPTWNDKFVFRVDNDFLYGDTSAVMIEIYAHHWFRDVLVGTVRVIVGNLIPPTTRSRHRQPHQLQLGMRFVALQVRRPSGRPQGILNIGVALLDSTMRSMPLYTQISASAVGYRDLMGEEDTHNHQHHNKDDEKSSDDQFLLPWIPKPELRRTKSDTSSMIPSDMVTGQKRTTGGKASSMISGSEVEKKKKKKHNYGRTKGRSKVSNSAISGSELMKKGRVVKKDEYSRPASLLSGTAFGPLPKPNYSSTEVSDSPPGRTRKGGKPSSKATGSSGNDTFARYNGSDLSSPYFGHVKKLHTPNLTDSELGPSASEVAATVAVKNRNYKVEEPESEAMGDWSLESSMEGLQSKLERWRTELPPVYDRSELSSLPMTSIVNGGKPGHRRRRTDGGGEFSCFSNICGLEISIVCGGNSERKKGGRVKRSPSMGDFSFL